MDYQKAVNTLLDQCRAQAEQAQQNARRIMRTGCPNESLLTRWYTWRDVEEMVRLQRKSISDWQYCFETIREIATREAKEGLDPARKGVWAMALTLIDRLAP